jgi:hypothetical protein
MNRLYQLQMAVLVGLCLTEPGCEKAKEAREAAVLKEEVGRYAHVGPCQELFYSCAFPDLSEGGRMYAGTVESVEFTHLEPDLGESREYGKVSARVQRVVRGPAVKELRLGYWFWKEDGDAGRSPLTGDLVGASPWRKRPEVGEHLLLSLNLNPYRRAEQNWERDVEVDHVWVGVGPDHPLVQDFEVAVRYLDTRDEAERRACFRRLYRSAWPSVRAFALDAAAMDCGSTRGPKEAEDKDWSPECRATVEYLKAAGPLLRDWERPNVTRTLRWCLCSGYDEHTKTRPFGAWVSRNSGGVAAEWLAAFEDWYLAELGSDAMRPRPKRSEQALIELRALIYHFGVDGAAAFFWTHGRDGLEERLQTCARSDDPCLAVNAKQWLNIIRARRKVAAGTVTNSEGDSVSLQTVIPDTRLFVDLVYRAENLPPGASIDPATGVISGRIQNGAARNSPYKVGIFYGPRTRQDPGEERRNEFSWVVQPRARLVE